MYEFASSVINVWEKKLFNKLDQERMLKSPSREDAFLALFDTDLGQVAKKQEKDIEQVLEKDMLDLRYKFERILAEKKELFYFLFLRFDALNLKLALKRKQAQIDFSPFSFAIEPYELLVKQALAAENNIFGKGGNPFVETMIDLAKERLKPIINPDSVLIEQAVDLAYFQTKLVIAKSVGRFLQEITRLEIDTVNIRNLISKGPESFIQGGNLKMADLEKLIHLKEGEIVQDLKKFLEVLALSSVLEQFEKDHSQIILEKRLKAALSEKIFQKEKETGIGPEKALAFWQRKLNGYANIRLIIFAKEQGLASSEIEAALLPL